jgi:N-hydroxyarylamine O-acetyltransferase
VQLDNQWTRLYQFLPSPQLPIDYEQANWFTATHPESLFTNHLLMARPEPDRRYALFDREFTLRHRDGRAERRMLSAAADIADVLSRCFRIAPSAAERDAGAVWERLST